MALTLLRRSQHVLFLGLTALGAARAVADDRRPLLTIVLSVALLIWYAFGVAACRVSRTPRLWLLILALGWAALVVISVDFVWLAFALFLLCAQVLTFRAGLAAVAILTCACVGGIWLHRGGLDGAAVLGPAIGAAVAIVIMVVYRDLQREAQTGARLLTELATAQQQLADVARQTGAMAERERLAREIHDTVGQSLSSIILLLRSARGDGAPPSTAAGNRIDLAEHAAQSALEGTRRLVQALAPAELTRHSLPQALSRLADHTTELGLDTALVVDGDELAMPTALDVALLRVAQEALANVRRHAGATRAVVTLTYLPHAVSLDVVDDGRGFAPDRPPPGSRGTGVGLGVMRSRITEVGGSLTIESAPGQGTALNATIPTGDRR